MRLLLMGLAALCCASCSSLHVSHDYELSADFDGLQRFAWMASDSAPQVEDELLIRRVRVHAEHHLAERGFVFDARESPGGATIAADAFLVAYDAREQRLRVTDLGPELSFGFGYRGGAVGGFGARRIDIADYDERVLVLEVHDARGGEPWLVWRGVARWPIRDTATPQERDRRARDAVERLLEAFPPS